MTIHAVQVMSGELFDAIESDEVAVVQSAIDSGLLSRDIRVITINGQEGSALLHAVVSGSVRCIECLVRRGVFINGEGVLAAALLPGHRKLAVLDQRRVVQMMLSSGLGSVEELSKAANVFFRNRGDDPEIRGMLLHRLGHSRLSEESARAFAEEMDAQEVAVESEAEEGTAEADFVEGGRPPCCRQLFPPDRPH